MPPMRGNNAPAQKAKHTRKALIKLFKYSKRCLPAIIIALTIAIVSAVFSIVGPKYVGKLGDYIAAAVPVWVEELKTWIYPENPMNYKAIVDIAVFLITIYAVGAVLSYVQGYIMNSVTQRVSKSLRNDISRKINRLPLRYFDTNLFGDVLSRVTNDVDTIAQSLNQSVVTLVTSVTMLVGVLVMMFTINWIMALTVIGATIIGFAFMMIIMAKSQKHFLAQQRNLGAINGHVEEIYSGHNVVKVLGGEKNAKQTFNEINAKLYASSWKSQFLSGLMMPIMNFVGNFGFVAVCVVGGALAISGIIKVGVIISFMIYVRLFTNPLAQIAQAMNSMQSAAAASERVFEFLGEEELTPDTPVTLLENVRGEVEFKNVHFGYDPERTIINDFSAHVLPGQKVAIVGPTGAGKTTMVNLLMRFYEVNSGSITVDGVDIKDLTRENIHDLFGMVLQDTWLFEGTVRENIVYSKTDATEEKVIAAAKAAGLDHFIRTLPHGYDTVLNDKTNISAGQKQLITIARAMVEDAPMLILDEATSSVDTRTEVLIQKAMDSLTKGRTSFVIAHRLSTIKNADLILVMKDGDVIESGSHDELMSKGGFYSDLYNSQFATE